MVLKACDVDNLYKQNSQFFFCLKKELSVLDDHSLTLSVIMALVDAFCINRNFKFSLDC